MQHYSPTWNVVIPNDILAVVTNTCSWGPELTGQVKCLSGMDAKTLVLIFNLVGCVFFVVVFSLGKGFH